MICLIRENISIGEFKFFRQSIEALKCFGKVGDFIVGDFEIATKTEKGIEFKPKFQRARDSRVEALKLGHKIVMSSLA